MLLFLLCITKAVHVYAVVINIDCVILFKYRNAVYVDDYVL